MTTQPTAAGPDPGVPAPDAGPRYAWCARVSTEDLQDPTISLPRQLANCEAFLARHGGRLVAWYWDVESGAKPLARRPGGTAGFDVPLPRDGGLVDLLAHARGRPRPFDRVIVENVNRVGRRSAVTFGIEDDLRDLGIRLCASDEPLEESFGSIVLRHVNVGIAKGYHHELMVKSWQGREVSVQQGWHAGGIALYGYRFVLHPHPNPHKARQGLHKRTLELDPARAPVVRLVYDLYLAGGLGLKEIRDRLNTDPHRYPPPASPDPARALGAWSTSTLWEMLRNPKYTGYQVWNRRATKKGGRANPPEAWVWSAEPAHPPIVSREEHNLVRGRAAANEKSRRADSATPTSRAVYLYRSLLRCGVCGLRMWGNRRRSTSYYTCQPGRARAAVVPGGHPASVYLAHDDLHTALLDFLATNVFGPERDAYWRHALTVAGQPERRTGDPAAGLRAEIADLQRRLDRQILALEDDDVTLAVRRRITARASQLDAALGDRRQRLAQLLADQPETTDPASVVAALARLPILGERLHTLPQPELRALLDSLHFTASYRPDAHAADITITLRTRHDSDRDAQVCSVHSAEQKPNLRPVLEGSPVAVSGRHAKVRRDGYRRPA